MLKIGTVTEAKLAVDGGVTKVAIGEAERYEKVAFVGRMRGGDDAALEVQARITLPEGTRLDRAVFEISAAPGDRTKVSSVATLRASEVPGAEAKETGCAVDFGRLLPIADFYIASDHHFVKSGSGAGIHRVFPWTGSGWSTRSQQGGKVEEMQTEKLLVTTTSSGDLLDALTQYGVVVLPAQPTGLELQVEGMTVWFERQGSTADLAASAAAGTYAVDRTDAVRDALAKARPTDGKRAVTITLRASTPGQLALVVRTDVLHEYRVPVAPHAFTSTTAISDEGITVLGLAEHDVASPFAASDSIRKVSLTVRGAFGPERIEPVEEPVPVDGTLLVLADGRTVLFGIRSVLTQPFGQLQALRLKLSSTRGGEIAGRLLGGDPLGRPGEAVTGGAIPPVSIAATPLPTWMTIPFPKPVALPDPKPPATLAAIPYWLELTSTYGEVVCALTRDTQVPSAPLIRRLPGGGTRPLSVLGRPGTSQDESPLMAPLRVVGLPGSKEQLPAVTFRVDGPTPPAVSGTTPATDGLALDIGLGSGVPPTAGAGTSRLVLPLRLRIAAPGTLTLDDVVVLYRKGGDAS